MYAIDQVAVCSKFVFSGVVRGIVDGGVGCGRFPVYSYVDVMFKSGGLSGY
jgi:hypothetical protein